MSPLGPLRRSALLLTLLCAGWGDPAGVGHAEDATPAVRQARALTAEAARLLEVGRPEEAAEVALEALALLPQGPQARRNAALALAAKGSAELDRQEATPALLSFERALELHPGRLAYRVGRSRALLALGGLAEAERELRQVLELDPWFVDASRLLGDLLERAGRLNEAVEVLSQVLGLGVQDAELGRRISLLARRAQAEERYQSQNTGHFEARYDPDLDPGAVTLALTLLEDAHARVTAELGLLPRTPARVILYPDDEFRALTGAHAWVGALYGAGVLRVPMRNLERHRSTAERVLAHEYTHHLLHERTPRLPVWWHEAVAQWMEHGRGAPTAASQAQAELASALSSGGLLTLEELRSTQILRVSDAGLARLFYTQALAFLGWLMEQRGGASRLTAFLLALGAHHDTEAAARSAWGASETELYREWSAALRDAAASRR